MRQIHVKQSKNCQIPLVQKHLKQIGKISRAGVWISHKLSKENKLTDLWHATYYFNDTIHNRFLIVWSIETKIWFYIIFQNAKDCGFLQINYCNVHLKKALLCVWWCTRVIVNFEVLQPGQTVNADLYCKDLDRVNQSFIEENPAIVNRKGVILCKTALCKTNTGRN